VSYDSRRARRGEEVEVRASPVTVSIVVCMTICYLVDGDAGTWFFIAIGLGVSVAVGCWLSGIMIRRAREDDEA
jgi:hypothetical protein